MSLPGLKTIAPLLAAVIVAGVVIFAAVTASGRARTEVELLDGAVWLSTQISSAELDASLVQLVNGNSRDASDALGAVVAVDAEEFLVEQAGDDGLIVDVDRGGLKLVSLAAEALGPEDWQTIEGVAEDPARVAADVEALVDDETVWLVVADEGLAQQYELPSLSLLGDPVELGSSWRSSTVVDGQLWSLEADGSIARTGSDNSLPVLSSGEGGHAVTAAAQLVVVGASGEVSIVDPSSGGGSIVASCTVPSSEVLLVAGGGDATQAAAVVGATGLVSVISLDGEDACEITNFQAADDGASLTSPVFAGRRVFVGNRTSGEVIGFSLDDGDTQTIGLVEASESLNVVAEGNTVFVNNVGSSTAGVIFDAGSGFELLDIEKQTQGSGEDGPTVGTGGDDDDDDAIAQGGAGGSAGQTGSSSDETTTVAAGDGAETVSEGTDITDAPLEEEPVEEEEASDEEEEAPPEEEEPPPPPDGTVVCVASRQSLNEGDSVSWEVQLDASIPDEVEGTISFPTGTEEFEGFRVEITAEASGTLAPTITGEADGFAFTNVRCQEVTVLADSRPLPPNASISFDPPLQDGAVPEGVDQLTLIDTSEPEAAQRNWIVQTPSGSIPGNDSELTIDVSAPGNYTATLEVRNDEGATDTATRDFVVVDRAVTWPVSVRVTADGAPPPGSVDVTVDCGTTLQTTTNVEVPSTTSVFATVPDGSTCTATAAPEGFEAARNTQVVTSATQLELLLVAEEPESNTVVIPDISTLPNVFVALDTLENLGLAPVAPVFPAVLCANNLQPEVSPTGTDPAAGQTVDRGSSVQVLAVAECVFTIPDVSALSFSAARDAVRDAGFGLIVRDPDPADVCGTPTGGETQRPAGTEFRTEALEIDELVVLTPTYTCSGLQALSSVSITNCPASAVDVGTTVRLDATIGSEGPGLPLTFEDVLYQWDEGFGVVASAVADDSHLVTRAIEGSVTVTVTGVVGDRERSDTCVLTFSEPQLDIDVTCPAVVETGTRGTWTATVLNPGVDPNSVFFSWSPPFAGQDAGLGLTERSGLLNSEGMFTLTATASLAGFESGSDSCTVTVEGFGGINCSTSPAGNAIPITPPQVQIYTTGVPFDDPNTQWSILSGPSNPTPVGDTLGGWATFEVDLLVSGATYVVRFVHSPSGEFVSCPFTIP